MYDFDDELIRHMVEMCHVPAETIMRSGSGTNVVDVLCEKDGSKWPCEAVSGLRQWKANNPAPQVWI